MSLREKDYLRRAIEDLAKLVARVMGVRAKGRPAEALDTFRRESGELLDLPRETLDALDPASVKALLGDPKRVLVYARILEEEAGLVEANGGDASWLRARASALG